MLYEVNSAHEEVFMGCTKRFIHINDYKIIVYETAYYKPLCCVNILDHVIFIAL